QVVKRIAKVVSRRWRLGIGYVDLTGQDVVPPQVADLAAHRNLCRLILSTPVGARSCGESGRSILHDLEYRARAGRLSSQPWVTSCHAGLHEIVAPVLVDGECIGAFVSSGFLPAQAGSAEDQ